MFFTAVITVTDCPSTVVVPPSTSSSSSGIVIGVVLGSTVVVILILLAVIVPVILVRKRNAAGGGITRHLNHLPHPQQQILNFYTRQSQPQQASVHPSAQPRTGIQTNIYAATSVNTQSPAATQTPNEPMLSKPHTGDLTDSAPPSYDEALNNYPPPTAKGSKLPPPYSQ